MHPGKAAGHLPLLVPEGACQREVEPYRLLYRWRDWYLWGWCRLRQDYRLFKLSRLWEPEAGPSFPGRELPPGEPDPDRYLREGAIHLKALFAPEAAYRLVEEYGPGSWTETEKGLLLERELIEECGRLAVPGRPIQYRTTQNFLRSFGLASLDDLPDLASASQEDLQLTMEMESALRRLREAETEGEPDASEEEGT